MSSESHGPETGVWKRHLGRFYFTGTFWYKFPLWGVRVLPMWAVPIVISICTFSFTIALYRARRAIGANLKWVLGDCSLGMSWLRAFRTIRNFSWCLCERYEQFLPDVEMATTVETSRGWTQLQAQGKGAVFVTAHYGGWEIGSVTTQDSAKPMVIHSVREREIDPKSNELLKGMLHGLGGAQYHIHYANEDVALGILLLKALRKGEFVALQADRPATNGQTIELELFGQPVKLPVGPAVLAQLADVPMVPVFTPRLGRRQYHIVVGEPIVVPRTRDRDADFRQAMQDLLSRIEDVIRQDPHQWFCLRDLRADPLR